MNDVLQRGLVDSLRLVLPEAVLALAACVLFLVGLVRASRHLAASGALLALVLAGLVLPTDSGPRADDLALYVAPVLADGLACFLRLFVLGAGALFILASWDEVADAQAADYYACLLLVLAGLGLTGAANDLLLLFLSLELISIPTYVLLYLPRRDAAAQEAALKYFLLSIFSSALLLLGLTYLYGATGVTNLSAVLQALNATAHLPPTTALALILILGGLGFRLTAVPFHFYAPDVYQGAPTVLAALLALVPKAAGFTALLRVLGFVLPPVVTPRAGWLGLALSEQTPVLLWLLAALTMTLGNFLALRQENLKRLLAYSSVAHAGYLLMPLAAAPYLAKAAQLPGGFTGPDGVQTLLYYLVAYGLMTVGAFAVLAYLDTPERPIQNVEDLAGLSTCRPGPALLLALFLFSLMGVPLTAGFNGKLFIFFGVLGVPADPALAADAAAASRQAQLFRVLALIGVLNAAIGAWYYLRILAVMYLRTAIHPLPARPARPLLAAILVCAILTVGFSIPPGVGQLLYWARLASPPPPAAPAAAQGAVPR